MSQAEFDRMMPLQAAAELAGLHPQTLRAAVRRRELAVVRLGANPKGKCYIRMSALDTWLKRQTIAASRVREV